jgi:threonine/homoserine/homoserine lactone efflux protein
VVTAAVGSTGRAAIAPSPASRLKDWCGYGPHNSSIDPSAGGLPRRRAFRDGLLTSITNPKLAVFFVALFPQFVEDRAAVLPTTLLMAALIVTFDFASYTWLAVLVSRTKRGLMRTRVARWVERTTGAVLIALGARVAIEQR